MYIAAYSSFLSSFVQVLGTSHIHQPIVGERAPYTHHPSQVEDKLNILNGRSQCACICNISAYHLHTLFFQLICIFYWQYQCANIFASLLQLFNQVSPQQPCGASNQCFHISSLPKFNNKKT